MKRFIFITLFLSLLYASYSEIVILENRDVIKGTITNQDEEYIYMKTGYGELKIKKNKVDKILFNDAEYNESELQNESSETEKKKRMNSTDYYDNKDYFEKKQSKKFISENYSKDALYLVYKKYNGIGIGFCIPGSIILGISVISLIPSLVFCNPFLSTTYSEYDYETERYTDYQYVNMSGVFLFTFFSSLGLIGLIFELIAAVNFYKANKYFKQWSEKISLDINTGNNNIALGLRFKF